MSKDFVIGFVANDWHEKAVNEKKFLPKDEDELLDGIENGMDTADVAICGLVSRELEVAPPTIFRPVKILTLTGAMSELTGMLRQKRKTEVITSGGNTYEIPAFIGHPGRPPGEKDEGDDMNVNEADTVGIVDYEDDAPSYVTRTSEIGHARAVQYLEKSVPTQIWNSLVTVDINHGSVTDAARELKKKIDEMVKRITKPA